MAVALLDVNVLVALFAEDHVHHDIAHDWFADHGDAGWASCPLTENGLIRILGNPARVGQHLPIAQVVSLLDEFCANSAHRFWPDDVSLRDRERLNGDALHGHQQVADAYLLGLAVKNRGRLVTLDRRVPVAAVKGARPEHLVVITAGD
jgi:uncharacterized protein